MERNRTCGICNKTFASGKAMGGHMRSHYAKLPISSRINRTQIIDSSSPVDKSTSSSSFSDSGSPTRSKRRLRWIGTPESPPQSQSVISSGNPDSLSVEEVAMSLVMLSMDKLSTEEARRLVIFKDGLEAGAEQQQLVDQRRQSYRSEACEKVFKTYQALGGHRATTHQKKNKKMKICMEQEERNTSVAAADDHEEEEDDKFVLCAGATLFGQSAKAVGEH